jgi:hypothetical protein
LTREQLDRNQLTNVKSPGVPRRGFSFVPGATRVRAPDASQRVSGATQIRGRYDDRPAYGTVPGLQRSTSLRFVLHRARDAPNFALTRALRPGHAIAHYCVRDSEFVRLKRELNELDEAIAQERCPGHREPDPERDDGRRPDSIKIKDWIGHGR